MKGRPAEAPVLDLAEGVRVYLSLQNQSRELNAVMEQLRVRLLEAMERTNLDEFFTDGIQTIRQMRRLPPKLNQEQAEKILRREGRLREAQHLVLDPDKARQVLDDLYSRGKIEQRELPYREPREVPVLIVRPVEEESQ